MKICDITFLKREKELRGKNIRLNFARKNYQQFIEKPSQITKNKFRITPEIEFTSATWGDADLYGKAGDNKVECLSYRKALRSREGKRHVRPYL